MTGPWSPEPIDAHLFPAAVRVPFAALLASVAAGPLCMIVLVLLSFTQPHPPGSGLGSEFGAMFVMSTIVGFAISIVPNLVGTSAMFLLARRWRAATLRRSWVAAGAIGGSLSTLFTGISFGEPLLVLPLVVVGACCAAICHLVARPD